MKPFLTYRDRDFDVKRPLPWNAADLARDLELDTLLGVMASNDEFIFEAARSGLFSAFETDVSTILYRQKVLEDCLKNAVEVRSLYELTVQTIAATRKHARGYISHYPSSVLHSSIELLEQLLGGLRSLRDFAKEHENGFRSEAFTALFGMLKKELDEEYLSTVQRHLSALKFRQGVSLNAQLGDFSESTKFALRETNGREPTWFRRLFPDRSSPYTFYLDERDEAGAQIVSEMRYRGISRVAIALAQSADHVLSFFKVLRTELAFYTACLNLNDCLRSKDEPVCFPVPEDAPGRTLRFRGLYDVCLSLRANARVVGNDMDGGGKSLVIITGANQGGKSTFLRSVGLAQLMMQAGMFVAAEVFVGSLCPALFTHFKREEDKEIKSGKLDEELGRMSEIVDHIRPTSIVLFNESFAATNEREGSEIAAQIVAAVLEKGVRVFFVTHLYTFATGFVEKWHPGTMFLRAERAEDGTRTFRLSEGEPLETSYGTDLYHDVFGVLGEVDGA